MTEINLLMKLANQSDIKLRGRMQSDGSKIISIYDTLSWVYPQSERRDKRERTENEKTAFARQWFGDNIKSESGPYYNEFKDMITYVRFSGEMHEIMLGSVLVHYYILGSVSKHYSILGSFYVHYSILGSVLAHYLERNSTLLLKRIEIAIFLQVVDKETRHAPQFMVLSEFLLFWLEKFQQNSAMLC
jgi:hypothetical protein